VDHSSNPYYQPTESEEDPALRYPPKLADALARMKEHPCPGAMYWVYVAAYARSGDFYIDVARSHKDMYAFCFQNQEQQRRRLGERQCKPLRLVLTEAFLSEAEARRRCLELRAMPHAWQRRIVDDANPEWLDLDQLIVGFPWVCRVGEDGLAPFSPMR
jgi:predicted GIY-YIG superfamily endonuclease